MKLTVFQSDKGDCLLLSSSDQRNMLIDGGMAQSFNKHTAQHISDIGHLDRVCVTHIDQDHIHGILEMCEHIISWKVYNFQRSNGNTKFKKPKFPEPPTIDAFWHNSFEAQFGRESSSVASSAMTLSSVFSAGSGVTNSDITETLMGIAQSQRQGYLLSQKLGTKLLNIPINPEAKGELLLSRKSQNTVFSLGKTTIRLIGPMKTDIDKLRDEWATWIKTAKGAAAIEKIRSTIEDDESKGASSAAVTLLGALSAAEKEANISLKKKAKELGLRRNVTTPNLASIMFIAEEGTKKMLFTGDGHWEDIDSGIDIDGKFNSKTGVHFDVIKVPHHGSEHNSRLSFWRRMTADNYIFCSNGSHENPDIRILRDIVKSRLEDEKLGKPHSGKDYKFWFNASSKVTSGDNARQMKKIERFVKTAKANKRLSFKFLSDDSFSVSL